MIIKIIILSLWFTTSVFAVYPTDYMTVKTFLVRAPSGQTVTITNRAFIAFANNIGGTNYISMEISKPSTIYGVIP